MLLSTYMKKPNDPTYTKKNLDNHNELKPKELL